MKARRFPCFDPDNDPAPYLAEAENAAECPEWMVNRGAAAKVKEINDIIEWLDSEFYDLVYCRLGEIHPEVKQ